MHLLLNYGAGHAIADGDGLHPITLSCIKGHHETTRILLAHGAALACRDEDGLMPLHWACIGGHHKCARVLLEYGADPNVRWTRADETSLCSRLSCSRARARALRTRA